MTPAPRQAEQRLATLAACLRGSLRPPSATELERGLQQLRQRLAAERGRPRLRRRRASLAALSLACSLLGVAAVWLCIGHFRSATTPLSVTRVRGGEILEGGYVAEIGRQGVELGFNEGSVVVLSPGTRGTLRRLAADGASFELGHGSGSFNITPSAERRWLVEAGPFVVTVKGTDFSVVWEPTTELLEVELRRGRVTVSGPLVGGELGLRPGQRLTVSLPGGETRIVETRPASVASLPSAELPAVEAVPHGEPPPATPVSPPPSASAARSAASAAPGPSDARDWRRALASGQWDRIIADVERAGVATRLRTLSSEELFLLADAARYERRSDLSRAALEAVLERFPNAPRSADALFLLGRVEEQRADGKALAIQRYEQYLSRAGRGTYAAPALGRKMVLVQETRGRAAARPIADDYLRRFPTGSYAQAARSLLRAP